MAKYSIGAKIFAAFVAMSLLIAAIGLAGYGVLSAAGDIAVTTFDGPLMAISYARAAHTDFTELQVLEQRFEKAPPAGRVAIVAEIDDMAATFTGDLGVAAQRAGAQDELRLIAQIAPLVKRWQQARARGDHAELLRLDGVIDEKFDLLTELITDHSFVNRRQTVSNIANFKYVSIAVTVLALLLATGITLLLRSRIVRPLRAAASVADRIARGELETTIPRGGPDETGALLKSMTVMQDNIREAMAREKSLRRSAENRLVDALETSREGVMLVAADGSIVMANSTLRSFFPAIAYHLTPGIQFSAALETIRGQLKPGQMSAEDIVAAGQAELELADGRWLRMTGSATSEGGSIYFLSDFTAVKDREESLRRAKRDAEAANAAKTRFLANMSHELRTPLNAIIGFSDIMQHEVKGPLSGAYQEYAALINESGLHLLNLVSDILDLAKIEAGKFSIDAREIDLMETVDLCLRLTQRRAEEGDITLVKTVEQDSLPLTADPRACKQILLNLLSNAVKFTRKGGTVEVIVAATGERVSLKVRDTGIGIPEELLPRLGGAFEQGSNDPMLAREGTGLGLALVKALVAQHGGSVSIESRENFGTVVSIDLPRAQPDRAAA